MTNKKEEPEEKEEAWVSTLINEIFNELEIKESWEYKFTSQTGNVTFQDKQSFITFIKDKLKEENWSKEKANIYRDFIIMDIIVEKLEKIKKLSKKKKQDKLDEMRIPKKAKEKMRKVKNELEEINLQEITETGKSQPTQSKILDLLEKLNKRMGKLEKIFKEEKIEKKPKKKLTREEKIALLDNYYYEAMTNPKFKEKKGDFQKFLAKQSQSNRNLPNTPTSLILPQLKSYNNLLVNVFDELQIRELISHWEIAYKKEENTNMMRVGFEFTFLGESYFFEVLSHPENLKDPYVTLDGEIQGITDKFQSGVDFELAFLGFLHKIFDEKGFEKPKDWK